MKTLYTRLLLWLFCCLGIQFVSHANSLQELALSNNYHKIQLSKLSTGHDIVSATINGVSGFFVLDTGAMSLVNQALESKYHLSSDNILKTNEAAGAGGVISISVFSINTMSLGDVPTSLNQIGSSDLNTVLRGIYNATGQVLDGIIGQDVLMPSQAIVDIRNKHLFVKPGQQNSSPDWHQTMFDLGFSDIDIKPISFKEFDLTFMTVTAKINGTNALLVLDSGAGKSVLNSASLTKFKLNKKQLEYSFNSSGAGGVFGINTYQLGSFELNRIEINKPSIATANLSAVVDFIAKHTGRQVDGVLGQDVLTSLAAVINLADAQLYLKLN